jgi:diguanylate cyclase (GGDEF)-like protein
MTKIFYSFDHVDHESLSASDLNVSSKGFQDMPPQVKCSLFDMRDLFELLRRQQLTIPFRLALYTELDHTSKLPDTIASISRLIDGQKPCNQRCIQQWEDLIDLTLVSNRPQVHSCSHGFLGFAIPVRDDSGNQGCLLGGGVREQLPAIPGSPAPDMAAGQVTAIPSATREEARKIAEEIHRLLPKLLDQKQHEQSLTHTTDRLSATREVARELSRCNSASEAFDLASEALVVLFDLPRIIFVLWQSGQRAIVQSTLGIDPASFTVSDARLQEVFDKSREFPVSLAGDELAELLPGLKGHEALLFPLQDGVQSIGLLVLLDVELHPYDQALVELLTSRLTARLLYFSQEETLSRERLSSSRLFNMIGALAQTGTREELFQGLLDMSAELASATSGSLMLFDEHTQKLSIVAAKRLSAPLVRSLSVSFGEGIAGRVASSGAPLLVSDIERDTRTASPNRPRFRTKSFISMPVRHLDRLICVLNLADKQDGSCFTEADLNLVQSFVSQAVLMIERTNVMERNEQLEKLSVTDPLTGLYNRRFLETRLEEERSRSQRQDKPFSIIFADLDNFKMYNDLCGHLAGDKALSKTAGVMRRTAREMDVVVRYGGEEFCLILPGTSKKEAFFLAERLRQAVEAESFPGEINLPRGQLTISLGIACYPDDSDTTHNLLAAADLALYRAKELGRNRTVLYDVAFARQEPAVINLTDRL